MVSDSFPLIYIVTMHRYGDDERHSYILGVYSKSQRARREAEIEEDNRSGKYVARITEMHLDWNYDVHHRVIREIALVKGVKPWIEIATEHARLTIPNMATKKEKENIP